MYRIFTEQDGKKLWLSAPKKQTEYSFSEIRLISISEKPGSAKKFATKESAQSFIREILTGGKEYFEARESISGWGSRTFDNRFSLDYKPYSLPKELISVVWDIEAIHNTKALSHDQICKIGCTFLKERGCNLVTNQPYCYANSESPDAIGFHTSYESHLVEAKTSKADFLSDKNKYFRINPEFGMGVMRWYMCEPGVIKPDELPENWGLVYVQNGVREIIVEAKPQERNLKAELDFLYQTARRGIGGKDGWNNG